MTASRASARINLAKLYRREAEELSDPGQLSQADWHLSRALEVDPRNTHALMELAVVRKDQGRPREAVAVLLRTLEIYPEHPGAHYSLGILYRDALDRPDLAEEHFRRARDAEIPVLPLDE